jgi:toxin ParE1/3/4
MKVRFSRKAQRDLAEIHAYVAKDSATVASRFVARLIERARQLADQPLAGRQTDEPGVRVVVAPRLRYFIFYTVVTDTIFITHIRHTSRRRPRAWGR